MQAYYPSCGVPIHPGLSRAGLPRERPGQAPASPASSTPAAIAAVSARRTWGPRPDLGGYGGQFLVAPAAFRPDEDGRGREAERRPTRDGDGDACDFPSASSPSSLSSPSSSPSSAGGTRQPAGDGFSAAGGPRQGGADFPAGHQCSERHRPLHRGEPRPAALHGSLRATSRSRSSCRPARARPPSARRSERTSARPTGRHPPLSASGRPTPGGRPWSVRTRR